MFDEVRNRALSIGPDVDICHVLSFWDLSADTSWYMGATVCKKEIQRETPLVHICIFRYISCSRDINKASCRDVAKAPGREAYLASSTVPSGHSPAGYPGLEIPPQHPSPPGLRPWRQAPHSWHRASRTYTTNRTRARQPTLGPCQSPQFYGAPTANFGRNFCTEVT